MNSLAFFIRYDLHDARTETQKSLRLCSLFHWFDIFTCSHRISSMTSRKLWKLWKAETRFTNSILYKILFKLISFKKVEISDFKPHHISNQSQIKTLPSEKSLKPWLKAIYFDMLIQCACIIVIWSNRSCHFWPILCFWEKIKGFL